MWVLNKILQKNIDTKVASPIILHEITPTPQISSSRIIRKNSFISKSYKKYSSQVSQLYLQQRILPKLKYTSLIQKVQSNQKQLFLPIIKNEEKILQNLSTNKISNQLSDTFPKDKYQFIKDNRFISMNKVYIAYLEKFQNFKWNELHRHFAKFKRKIESFIKNEKMKYCQMSLKQHEKNQAKMIDFVGKAIMQRMQESMQYAQSKLMGLQKMFSMKSSVKNNGESEELNRIVQIGLDKNPNKRYKQKFYSGFISSTVSKEEQIQLNVATNNSIQQNQENKSITQQNIMHTSQFIEASQYEALLLEHQAKVSKMKTNVYQLDTIIDEENNHMHSLMAGEENNNNIVLVHGFGGSCLTYYKMLNDISKHYKVWCVDLLGMGLSGRPNYSCTDANQASEFFTNSLENWRKINNIKNFSLVGHSLGGLISTYYAAQYPERVNNLFLISPVGYSDNEKWVQEKLKLQTLGYRFQFAIFSQFYKQKMTCPSLCKQIGEEFTRKMITQYALTQFEKKFSSFEVGMFTEYFLRMFQLPQSSQIGLYDLLDVPHLTSKIPISDQLDILIQNGIHPHLFYGDRDWVDYLGPQRVLKKHNFKNDINIIKNSGHQIQVLICHIIKLIIIQVENPFDLVQQIIKFA